MPYSSYTIRPLERLLLLIADPLINYLCITLPLTLLVLPLIQAGWLPEETFLPWSIFITFATYLNKDIAAGKSLGKRVLGYALINVSDGLPPRRAVCFVRNLTCLIYPIEMLYGLSSTNKKISDHFTDTKVIKTVKDQQPVSSFFKDMKNIPYNNETREALGLTVLLLLLTFFLF